MLFRATARYVTLIQPIFADFAQLFKLAEKDFQSKLDILFKKNLFEVAELLAQNQPAGESTDNLIDIHTNWAGTCIARDSEA